VGLDGFDGPSSTLYHLHSPVRVLDIAPFRPRRREPWVPSSHVHHRFDGDRLPAGGDAVSARQVLAWNGDVEVALARPDRPMERFCRHAVGEELVFVHEGQGVLRTAPGDLPYRAGDYLVVPRGLTHRFEPAGQAPERHLVVVTTGPVETPAR